MHIAGVEISVKADLIITGTGRRNRRIGAAILRMTKDDATTNAAVAKRKEMGIHVATLILPHVQNNLLQHNQHFDPKLCLSIDVQHKEVFVAPSNRNSRRIRDLESACQLISTVWPTITNT
ncbi:MAG: hypothetical protein OXC62_15520 [Aestuariivita sp.]|nr:hypothetical protein [Aestuariivita sp.]